MKKTILFTLLFLISNVILAQDSFVDNVSENITYKSFNESKDLYTISTTSINSKLSDVGATFFMNKYIMFSSRKTGAIGAGRDENTNNPYFGLYCLNIDKYGNLSLPNFFAHALDSKGNEGSLAFSSDEKKVYVTRSETDNALNYQLYKFDFDGKISWINETAIEFNNVNYSIENPCITADGKKMYFSSNMPGGFGGYDLYIAQINENGMPINPENLGSTINTSKDEKHPYVNPTNNEIYFSSNGHDGYGNFDVFVSKIKKTRFKTPLNLGKTFNTASNEIAFILASKTRGYITSDRNEKTLYDIFKFDFVKKQSTIEGLVTEKESKIVLPNTLVTLIDEDGQEVSSKITDNNGRYLFDIEPLENHTIIAKKEGYLDFKLPLLSASGNEVKDIALNQKKAEIVKNAIIVENIYFDLGKATLKAESTLSLNKIIAVLNQNPEMKISIDAHTDSRGSDIYNMTLSEKRAAEVKKYLLKKGISIEKVDSKGYGETKSLSNCINCTAEQYNADRRVEFIIK